jgi:hypothetical protein
MHAGMEYEEGEDSTAGALEDSSLPAKLTAADIYLLESVAEALGRPLYETLVATLARSQSQVQRHERRALHYNQGGAGRSVRVPSAEPFFAEALELSSVLEFLRGSRQQTEVSRRKPIRRSNPVCD